MQVSAISANTFHLGYNAINPVVKCAEVSRETSFNSLTSVQRPVPQEEEMTKLYNSINKWKYFCHEQILGGKLNIIA